MPLAGSSESSFGSGAPSAGVVQEVEYLSSSPKALMMRLVRLVWVRVMELPEVWRSTPNYPSAVPSRQRVMSSDCIC